MGYTTEFSGSFSLNKALTVAQKKELEEFANTRHGGNMDSDDDKPGFYCQWVPNEDGTEIEWDGSEKFYHYVEWIEYLIEHFIKPWGLTLEGEVEWRGEEDDDLGMIQIMENEVETLEGKVTYR